MRVVAGRPNSQHINHSEFAGRSATKAFEALSLRLPALAGTSTLEVVSKAENKQKKKKALLRRGFVSYV